MKKFLLGLVAGILLTVSGTVYGGSSLKQIQAYVRGDLPVYLDGRELKLENPPLLHDGTTYMPIREMMQHFGKRVQWTAQPEKVDLHSLGDKDSYAFTPDWKFIILGDEQGTPYKASIFRIHRHTQPVGSPYFYNHSRIGLKEKVELPWGEASMVRLEQDRKIPVGVGEFDPLVYYWIYVTLPTDDPKQETMYVLEAEAVGEETAVKEQLLNVAETWKLPKE